MRVLLVWHTSPGLTIPVVAVNRVAGQYFVFLAEDSGGQTVAKQRPVIVGSVVGNNYVVQSGVKAGDRLIVGGIQKIRDGSPVKAMPPSGPGGPGGAGGPAGGR